MNNKYGLIGVIMTVLIGIILVGSVLAPTIEDLQKTAGDEITLTNNTYIVLREAESGDVLKCTSVYDADTSSRTDTWTLNNEEITNITGTTAAWNVGLMSDGMYLQINAANNAATGIFYDMTAESPTQRTMTGANSSNATREFTFTIGDTAITYTNSVDSTTYSFDYTWAYVICPYADGEYCAAVAGGTGIVASADDVVLCGAYTSGDNDTMYYYKDGTSYVANTAYTMTVDIDTEIHEGTTDILDATVSVDIGDETFTPYRILVPYEVSGHATDGAEYNLYGIIVVLFIVSLFAVAVTSILSRRD